MGKAEFRHYPPTPEEAHVRAPLRGFTQREQGDGRTFLPIDYAYRRKGRPVRQGVRRRVETRRYLHGTPQAFSPASNCLVEGTPKVLPVNMRRVETRRYLHGTPLAFSPASNCLAEGTL